jgi:hypothetical protein
MMRNTWKNPVALSTGSGRLKSRPLSTVECKKTQRRVEMAQPLPSPSPSSNRTCRFPTSGLPDGFLGWLSQELLLRLPIQFCSSSGVVPRPFPKAIYDSLGLILSSSQFPAIGSPHESHYVPSAGGLRSIGNTRRLHYYDPLRLPTHNPPVMHSRIGLVYYSSKFSFHEKISKSSRSGGRQPHDEKSQQRG